MDDYQAVRVLRLRLLHRLAPLAISVAGLVAPAVASAAPVDASVSSITCVDSDGGATRSGDELSCSLKARLGLGSQAAVFTGSVTLPDTVDMKSFDMPASYDEATRVLAFPEASLGLVFPLAEKQANFLVTIAADAAANAAVTFSGNLHAVGTDDGTVVDQAVESQPLYVSPPVADLSASSVFCADENASPLLPGETITCDLKAENAAGHEQATGIIGFLTGGGGVWLTGGTSTNPAVANFGVSDFGTIPAGGSKTGTARFTIPVSTLGGTTITSTAFLSGFSSPSGESLLITLNGNTLLVAPGPASLIFSSLLCSDTGGGLLLAGDDLTCTVTVRPAVGHEAVKDAAATVQIPANTTYTSGGDSHDDASVTLSPASLGDVAAGATKAASFHVKVPPGTAVGSQIKLLGTLTANSIPLGGPVAQPLASQSLTVGQEVVQPGETPTFVGPGVTPPVVTPVVVPSKSYKLKAKTIRFVMRGAHRRRNHVWKGSKRRFAYVKKFIVRTPKISGKVVKKVTVPKKGKWRPKRGKVRIKGTQLRYTLKKGVNPGKVKDRFHYTVTDTNGKKVTGTVVVSHKKS